MLLGLIILLISGVLALQFKPVQNFITKKATNYLAKELNTTVSFSSIYFKPFSSFYLKEFYIQDLDQDTLLYVKELSANVNLKSIRKSKIKINKIGLEGGRFSLKKYPDSTTNLDFLINYFSTEEEKEKENTTKLILSEVDFIDMDMRYRDYSAEPVLKGVNYGDVHLYALNGLIKDIDFTDHLFKGKIENLNFSEKSGLRVNNLSAIAVIDTNMMEFSQLDLVLNNSQIRDYVRFDFTDFSDFADFITNVTIESNLKNSKITSGDIAYFAPEVDVTEFDVFITGMLSGTVNNIAGKEVEIRTGRETWINGDLRIRGLPEIEETLFDMDLSRLRSTKNDLEQLIAELSQAKNFELPEIFTRLGKIDYKGRITGFYNNFIGQGVFNTALGDLITDINLDIRNGGKYSGEVFSPKFNIGSFLQIPDVEYASFRANIIGSGLSIDDLNEKLNGSLTYIDYKGYRYNNIKVDGTYLNEVFSGNIEIDDENLVLSFDGNLNLARKDYRYDFVSTIEKVNLHNLNLYSDSLSISGSIDADFTGNRLSTIDGRLLIKDLFIKRGVDTAQVDSLLLFTQMEDSSRVLAIESSVLDAKINGEFEIDQLPAYFVHLTKKYIPSLKTDLVNTGKQDFDFELKLKDFEPIAMFFAPYLTVTEEVFVTGKFSSEENTAQLTGFIPLVFINKMKLSNVIFDQTTGADALNLFVTADRLDITDSLFIDNINMATILRNDSLNFNIKLSDLAAENKLDLNGLVEFEEVASLSVLPSEVVINYKDWQILEKVRLDFDQGKVIINNLELVEGSQKIFINGAISKDIEDKLNVKAQELKLSTFNSLIKPFGIDIEGVLNGNIEINSILNQPYVLADLNANEIVYNNTEIGDMVLKAGWDQSDQLVSLNMKLSNGELETMDVEGTYDPNSEESPLGLQVKMNKTELVLFQPFLNKLVSNLSGTSTASLNIGGTASEPLINGSVSLEKAQFVVNYLKTAYTISKDLKVQDSKIILENVIIHDTRKSEAIANGSVDMRTPLNPTIQVDVKARNFMVLNTTVKDNPLYYGKAYGTGDFAFHGPTDDMNIRIVASTNAGTVIDLPLNSAELVGDRDFISFVQKDSSAVVKRINYFQGLVMNLDLTVTPEARAVIHTDLGKLSGNGEGLLTMDINSLGDFEMFGDYTISTGEFEFNAQDFINKKFDINRGGSIRWTGNPTQAQLNLSAIYEVRTSVQPLYVAAGRGSGTDQRVLTHAEMTLSGNLLSPEISFGINFPTDSYIKDELQSYLSDVNNVNQQALSLIVRRSFAPGTGTDLTRELNTTVLSAGTELAFNQLNNIISQSLNLNFVDFNIRSFNEASASIRLLSNRLILTGGVTDRRSEINDFNVFGKEVVSDIEALYLIRKSGNLLLRASNRLSNRNILNPTDEYISAVGLVYRQEFDTFKEYFKKLLFFGRKKEEVEVDDKEEEVEK